MSLALVVFVLSGLNQHRPQPQSKMPSRLCLRGCCCLLAMLVVGHCGLRLSGLLAPLHLAGSGCGKTTARCGPERAGNGTERAGKGRSPAAYLQEQLLELKDSSSEKADKVKQELKDAEKDAETKLEKAKKELKEAE